jgi:hypothetical protein
MESIDKARSIEQVKMVYEAITSSFAVSRTLSEEKTRKPIVNAQRRRTSGAPNERVLRESVDNESDNSGFARLQTLAGLIK